EGRPKDARSLLRALEPFSSRRLIALPQPGQGSPYAGLRPFQEADAARFFGRAHEIEAVTARIREYPLLAVVGPSGIGKTSFIRAGVLPALKNSGEVWETMTIRPGRDPIGALAALIEPMLHEQASVSDRLAALQSLSARLTREPGLLGNVLREVSRRSGCRYLVFIDQLEELYTLCDEAPIRNAFTACLASAADDAASPVRVVVAIRSDFLGRVGEQDVRFMGELAKALLFLGLPTQEGLRDAIVEPAEMMGYQFESPAIIDEMLEHLAQTPGALPLLQFTVFQLWQSRDPTRRTFSLQSYRELGGIVGALARHADSVLAKLEPSLRVLGRELFLQLVTPERTRASLDLRELREAAQSPHLFDELIEQFTASRLLCVQVDTATGRATIELVHESLIVAWPELRRWLDESLEDENFLAQLRAAARQWSARRDADLLWRGELVGELRRFLRRSRRPLTSPVEQFVQAVLRQESQRVWHRRGWAGLGAVVSMGLCSVAAFGVNELNNAKARAEQSEETTKTLNSSLEAANGRLESALEREHEQSKQAVRAKQEAELNAQAARRAQRLAEANARAAEANARAAKAALEMAETNAEQAKHANAELLNRLEAERAELQRFGEQNGRPGWVLK
ncbi:MAG: AAA family ATPase, partial [Myxococcales bacterium]